ncbi:MAG: tRNA (N(6)-L-threonylcarbamoyladenosine(37)-C(2))-methylthiotransferase MtaB [candidate division Zixibacteria bacterium]|nr:tRNA (N(6)-L-threonylcarbamoyladenosine(37)-C(2))-methylthiotransferase MtaB [candidate division Zixibacteria bacterium]
MNNEIKKKLNVHTIGCRLNQYETEKMVADLLPYGFERSENKKENADLYIINSCTVTHRADSTVRNWIRKVARQNPSGKIVVAGCYVDSEPELIAGMEGVDVIIHNRDKNNIAKILVSKIPELFSNKPDKCYSPILSSYHEHNRVWIKISDGCNQKCSFCKITEVRGPLVNRDPKEVIDEINAIVENGYKEVVLTGVHLGHYKNRKVDPQIKNLAALCRLILQETDLSRLRISSIEPQTVRDELLQVYVDSNGRICRHFHLPLQSGSSRILREMRRPYNREIYLKRVSDVKKAIPETNVGGDVIVGFPGETEEDYMETYRLAESGILDYLHVFSYSDRPGTVASQRTDKINPEIIKERNARLNRVSHAIKKEYYKKQIGKELEVISEFGSKIKEMYFGISDNYVKVKMPNAQKGKKEIVKIKITQAHDDYVG